ncbi:hypothetical protein [Streptomyces sp. NBC_00158]|uniref:hypothetical protein n=1 Tax=Streptomyces sp. NBC_00158 TaxID=2903627 RepID=UPI002F9075F5
MPEHGYDGRVEHDGVTLVFNCDGAGTARPTGTHTVCVDVRKAGDSPGHAAWPAERGRSGIGPPYAEDPFPGVRGW